jgi:TolA-binding protein
VAQNLVGQILGNYRILEPLGSGGMGVVYKAQDLTLGRNVALKLLRPATEEDYGESIERFRREARTASNLNHPNICTIYSFAEHNGQLLLAMELLDGDPLEKRIGGKPLDLRTTLEYATQIADALDAAHAEGVVHRDIKPANIFVSRRGQIKVLDFGLAKLAAGVSPENNVTQQFSSIAGTTVGTVSYMSPEQARGEELDQRSDLFSFGVVLYEMATGRQSFSGGTTAVVFDGILNREPIAPHTLNASVPPELERIIGKALEKDRSLRYQSAADMRADLQRLKRDSGSRILAAVQASTAETRAAAAAAAVTVAVPAATVGAPTPASPSAPTVLQAATAPAPRRGLSNATIIAMVLGVVALAIILSGTAMTFFALRLGSSSDVAPTTEPPAAPSATTPVAPPEPAPSPAVVVPSPPAAPVPVPAPPRPTAKAPVTEAPAIEKVPPSAETLAAQRLEIAQAKIANNLLDPALADLRQIVADQPGTQAAIEAAFLSASILEKMGRDEDAMAAHVEFNQRYGKDRRAPASKLRLAELVGRSRRPNRELAERQILNEVVRDYPGTPQALSALQGKLRIETQRKLREKDPVLGVEVPSSLVTLRTITEQFPNAPLTLTALDRLAEMYEDEDQHERAVLALTAWASRGDAPPDAWYRVGEFYERRLRDPARARGAFERVPPTSPRYRDAQRKLNRK